MEQCNSGREGATITIMMLVGTDGSRQKQGASTSSAVLGGSSDKSRTFFDIDYSIDGETLVEESGNFCLLDAFLFHVS